MGTYIKDVVCLVKISERNQKIHHIANFLKISRLKPKIYHIARFVKMLFMKSKNSPQNSPRCWFCENVLKINQGNSPQNSPRCDFALNSLRSIRELSFITIKLRGLQTTPNRFFHRFDDEQ